MLIVRKNFYRKVNSFKNGSNQVADLAWEFAWRTLRPNKVSRKDLRLVIDTLKVVSRPKETLEYVGSKKINGLYKGSDKPGFHKWNIQAWYKC